MAKADEVKVKIENLINKANATTGRSDDTLTEGVYSLIAGYGQGGGASTPQYDGSVAVEGTAQHIPYYDGTVVIE